MGTAAAAAGAAKGRQGFSGLSAGEAWETRCVARPEPRVSAPGKVRDAGAGVWRGPGSQVSAAALGHWKAPSGRRVRQSACLPRSASGALGFQRKTCRQSAGAPCAGLGTPGTGGPVWGVPASALGPRLTGLRAPAHPRSWPRFGGGKETGRFFLDGKKKIWAVVPGLSLPPRLPQPPQQILSEESAPPPGISAAGTLPRRGRAGGEAEESSTCHFLRL